VQSSDGSGLAPLKLEPVRIRFQLESEILQFDRWSGQIVARDKATETLVEIGATLEFRNLTQGFVVVGRIEEKGFNVQKLGAMVRAAVVAGLPKRLLWDFWRRAEVLVKVGGPELPAFEGESQIDDVVAPSLEAQAKLGSEATREWRAAIERMIEGLSGGFQYNRHEIMDGLLYLEWCHRSANNGLMGGWCEEKLGRIRSGLSDLASRKNPNHPKYRSIAENLRGWLRTWPVVNSWHQQPPGKVSRSS
jgi:hypothetical protein